MQRFTQKQYLAIDIASNFGLDKKTWKERLEWFDKNEQNLHSLVDKAAEPALFYAGCEALRDLNQGKKSGYPISLDATASGMQLLAVLTGDRAAAQLCNVINVPIEGNSDQEAQRRDGYTVIYQFMMDVLGENGQISRDEVKSAVMTSLYGSKAQPKRIFGEGSLLELFYAVMRELAPAAWEMNEAFLTMWRPDVLTNNWVLPDNFHVEVKVMGRVQEDVHFLNGKYATFRQVNMPQEEGRSLGANTIHSIDGMLVREMTRRCMHDPVKVGEIRSWMALGGDLEKDSDYDMVCTLWEHYKKSGFLSARILDHINPGNVCILGEDSFEALTELLDSLPKKPFQLVAVHDCFRCLPAYGNDLREQYVRLLYEIAKSDLLSYIVSQICGREVNIGKMEDGMEKDVLSAEYSLS